MRTPPTDSYTGFTVILDAPSRFDRTALLSGPVKDWFQDSCLLAPHTLASIDVRTVDEITPLLPGTKAIALLGPKCAARYGGDLSRHGYPLSIQGIPAVVAFDPQESNDHRSLKEEGDDETTEREDKDRSPTRRKNWRFWTAWHIRKLLSGKIYEAPKLIPRLYPPIEEACAVLDAAKGEDLYLDIETSRIHGCLTCVGFSTTTTFPRVFVVPVYSASGAIAYRDFYRFYRSLSIAFTNNTVVAHNGAAFDFLVLRLFYKFPFPTTPYDTLIANHRCFPEVEKSLAHVISQWTTLLYHKDEIIEPRNRTEEERLWLYNAKDVYALKLIKDAQLQYAVNVPGLMNSIHQANASIVPYLETSRTGLRVNLLKLAKIANRLAVCKTAYARVASVLVGHTFNPASTDQCRKFFHDKLHYGVVSKTDKGLPALGSKQLYQLHLKYNNPLIPVILKYREVAKDLSSLEVELMEEA